jgi:hypothetical protein
MDAKRNCELGGRDPPGWLKRLRLPYPERSKRVVVCVELHTLGSAVICLRYGTLFQVDRLHEGVLARRPLAELLPRVLLPE